MLYKGADVENSIIIKNKLPTQKWNLQLPSLASLLFLRQSIAPTMREQTILDLTDARMTHNARVIALAANGAGALEKHTALPYFSIRLSRNNMKSMVSNKTLSLWPIKSRKCTRLTTLESFISKKTFSILTMKSQICARLTAMKSMFSNKIFCNWPVKFRECTIL